MSDFQIRGEVTVDDKASGAIEKVGGSTKDLIVGFSGLAVSAFSLYQSFDRIEKSSVAVDRANLMVKSSANAVEDAQRRLTATIQKYGAESEEAKAATADLAIAQERLGIATDRAGLAQGNMNSTVMSAALSVVPTAITMFASLNTITKSLTGVTLVQTLAQHGLNAAVLANPITWIIIAIVAFIAALIILYNTCEPVKEAIDAIGKQLWEWLKPAVDALVNALTWLWQNVLVPLGEFLIGAFIGYINLVAGAIGWLVNIIGGGLAWIDEQLLKATGQWNNTVLLGMDNQLRAVEEGMQKQIEAVDAATEQLIADENAAYIERENAALAFWNAFVEPPVNAWEKIIAKVNDAYDTKIDDLRKWAAEEKDQIDKHYDDEIQKVNDAYNLQINNTNRYYDELIAVTERKLYEIKNGRTKDLDNLELEYLRRRKLINDEKVAAGADAEEILVFNKNKEERLKELETMYRQIRGEMTEGYRLKELEAEKTNSENVEAVNRDRAVAISKIEAEQAAEVKRLSDEKGATVLRVERETNAMVEYLNVERKSIVDRINRDREHLERVHYDTLQNIARTRENEITQIVAAAAAERERIIAESLSRIQGTQSQITGLQTTITAATTTVPKLAEGGVVTSPTFAYIGESGPEAVIPLNQMGAGVGGGVNYFTVNINVEGSVDEKVMKTINEQLRSVVVEATSTSGPTNLKRIRKGGTF